MDAPTKVIDNILYGPQIDIPVDERGLGKLIFDKMREYKHKVLQIDGQTNEEQTYESLNKKFIRIALEMRRRGINENDVVVTCSGNNPIALLGIYSTMYLNAIPAGLDPSLSSRDIVHLLKIVSPKLIFVTEDGLELIEKASDQLEKKPLIVVMGSHEKHVTLIDFLKPHPEEDTFLPDDVKDIRSTSNIYFSSGTTGLPKAVMHSHYSMMKAIYSIRYTVPLNGIALLYTSFYWISAFLFTTGVILFGGRRLFLGKFTVESFLKNVEQYKVSYAFFAPTFATQFSEEITKKYNIESLKEVWTGGCIINETQVLSLRKAFPKTGIRIGYGQTEVGSVASIFTKYNEELGQSKPGSCGVPYINVKLKISDLETRETLGPYQKGEICVLTESVFRGYLTSSDSALEDPFDHEGFLKTGDTGYYDVDNCLYFGDRIKEMFKYQSWHIVPASIESVIYDHPAILEAVVIGVPNEFDGHHPMALVVLKDSHRVTEEELLNFVNEKVTDRERLRAGLRIVKELAKTCTGKLARPEIRRLALNGN